MSTPHQATPIHPTVMIVAIAEFAARKLTRETGWDRATPLSARDRRFYGLREVVGYDGWIDQDGYPARGTKW